MVEGRLKSAWSPFSHLLAQQANIHRDRKRRSKPFSASDFSPFARRRKSKRTISVDQLAGDILGERKPKASAKPSPWP